MKKFISFCLLFIITLIVFWAWLNRISVVGGDTVYTFPSMIGNYPLTPFAWSGYTGNGFGSFVGPFIYTQPLTTLLSLLVGSFHLNFSDAFKFVLVYPFIISTVVGVRMLYQELFGKKLVWVFAAGIFTLNTYALMLVGGGQFPVALAYAFLPLVILYWSKFLKTPKIKTALIFVLAFSFQIYSDIRVVYMTILSLGLLVIFYVDWVLQSPRKMIGLLCIMVVFVFGLQAFWLLPTILVHQNPLQQLGSSYTSVASVQFLSFAKFENAIGLLHPNWPENIFGFTHFMRPEFLLLPLLSFGSLVFINKTTDKNIQVKNRNILFFVFVGLIGVFFAKGANDPFGGLYLWMFDHIPGFMMFRDPTKWYALIALSYAMLIPFSIQSIYEWLVQKNIFSIKSKIFNVQNTFLVLLVVYFLFLIKPALLHQLGGTLTIHTLPQDYITLDTFLTNEKTFSRVLWIPSLERYGYYSNEHPDVNALTYFQVNSIDQVLKSLDSVKMENQLQNAAIKYIIVPYDAEKEIFLKDRKYDDNAYEKTVKTLQSISWLKEIPGFGQIHVFSIQNAKGLFWLNSIGGVTYNEVSPTEYSLQVDNPGKPSQLVFTSTYDSHWVLEIGSKKISPKRFGEFTAYSIPKGKYEFRLTYKPQKFVYVGLLISVFAGIVIVGLVIFFNLGIYRNR